MYVRRPRLYAATQLIVDLFSLWPIWALSARLRIAMDPLTERQLTAEHAQGWLVPLGLIIILYVVLSVKLKLYAVPQAITPWSVTAWAGENSLAIFGLTVLATFFSHQFGPGASRIFVLCLVPVTFVTFAATRCVALACIALLQRRSPLPRVAIVGESASANRLIERLRAGTGTAIRGIIIPEGSYAGTEDNLVRVLGTTGQIAELVNREQLDSVIVINDSIPESELAHCNTVFWRMGLPVSCALSLAADASGTAPWQSAGKLEISRLNGLRVVDVRPVLSESNQDLIKRTFDLTISIVLLALASPAMLLIAALIKLNSKGPILEKAPRAGKGGRHFTCLKFRTTYEDLNLPAPPKEWNRPVGLDTSDGHHPTPLGKFLRRYSLDELPQLVNCIRGEMSLVGPRPLPAHNLGPDGLSQEFYAWSEARARVRPGLTGLWQVGGRSNLTFDNMIKLDLEYIRNRSFALDLSILLETPLAAFRGGGAS